MRDFFLITRMLLKNSYQTDRKKRLRLLGAGLLLIVGFAPVITMLYYSAYTVFSGTDLGLMYIETMLMAGSVLAIWTSIMGFPAAFYFSDDIKHLLVLPVRSWTILAAKLVLIYLGCAFLMLMVMLPVLAAYAWVNADIIGSLIFLIVIILAPVPVLLVIGSLTVVVMSFMPAFKNRDRFNMIMGILSIFFAIGIGILSSTFSGSQGQVINNFLSSNPQLLSNLSNVIFTIGWSGEAVVYHNWLLLAGIIIVCLALFALFAALSTALYLPAATSSGSSPNSRRKTREDWQMRSQFQALLIADFKTLMRTPAYFTNCVLGSFITPVLVPAILLLSPDSFSMIEEFSSSGFSLASVEGIVPAFFLAGAGLALLFTGTVNTASTAFTRMGSSLKFVKYIPANMRVQTDAKLVASILISASGLFIIMIAAQIILHYPVWFNLLYIAGALLGCTLTSLVGLISDAFHPKTNWADETRAVKNNYNMLIDMAFSWILLALFAGLFFLIGNIYWLAAAAGLVLIIMNVALYIALPKVCTRYL